MVVLGWALAPNLGRFTAPALFKRMDPAPAGTAGFLLRLAFIVIAAILSLRIALPAPAHRDRHPLAAHRVAGTGAP